MSFPRTQLSDRLRGHELAQAGVYILWGEGLAYIGESEDVRERFRQHDAAKPWWTRAYIVTAAGNALNKAHIRYLEARLIERARTVGVVRLDNSISPPWPTLSEVERANMEVFLHNLLLVLPALGFDAFVERRRSPIAEPEGGVATGPLLFELKTPKHGIRGRARLANGEFIVEAGSIARSSWSGGAHQTYSALYDELVRAGALLAEGDKRRFAVDYSFSSPSAAAAVLNWRSTNGAEAWREIATGRTYGEWERDRLLVS